MDVFIDDERNFLPHLNNIYKKMIQRKHIIRNHWHFAYGSNPQFLLQMFKAHILSILEYGCPLWIFRLSCDFSTQFHWTNKVHKLYDEIWQKIVIFYNTMLRRILGVPDGTATLVVYIRSGMFPLDYHLALNSLVWFLKFV